MQVLPDGGETVSNGVQFEQYPDLTWCVDQDAKRIRGTVTGIAAVKQAVDIILHVERFRWQIYSPYSGMQWAGLIGQNPGYVAAELQRRIADALMMDDRVRGISDFSYKISGDVMTATFTVNTIYGDIQSTAEVTTA